MQDTDPLVVAGTSPVTTPASAPAAAAPSSSVSVAVATRPLPVYQGRISPGWADYGWSERTMGSGPVTVDVGNFGGFILAWPAGADDLATRGPFVSLRLSFSTGPDVTSEVLGVQLADAAGTDFPVIGAGWSAPGPDGMRQTTVAFDQLDPLGKGFDRIVVKAARRVPSGTRVQVDGIQLLAG